MSLTLPDDLTWVLNLLGFMWPQADEDKLRACAQAWRNFGAEVTRINQDARLVAAHVTADNSGTFHRGGAAREAIGIGEICS
jgi:hypothetical protein